MREGSRGKFRVRLIDISTHGCRIECSSTVAADMRVWLNIAGLEAQNCRVVWHCQEFVGLEFEHPLAEAVLERLLQSQQQPPETRINELRDIAVPDALAGEAGGRRQNSPARGAVPNLRGRRGGRRLPAGRGQARGRQQKATSATRRRLTGHTGRWIMRRRPRH